MDGLIELSECVKHLSKAEKFAFDLETTGLDPRTDRIRGIGLAVEDRQWYFQVSGKNSVPLPTVKESLKTVFIDREKLCIGHNLKFDLQFCKTHEIPLNCKIGDTMILAYTLDENRSNTGRLKLKEKGGLIDELFGVELEGWDASDLSGNLFGKPEEVYAKADVEWTLRCWNKLEPLLNHYPAIQKFYWEVSMPIIRLISDMELAGMHVDTAYLLDYQKRLRKEADAIEEDFKKLTNGSVSIGSPAALSKYLFEDPNGQKLRPGPWMKKGKSGLYSTDEGTLARYAKENPMCQMILDWRGKNKLLSTYVGPFMEKANRDEGRRIYGSLSQTGTVTGRFCVSGDTILQTPEGAFRIDALDLEKYPDVSILTHTGRYKKILKKIYKGKEEMYEIRNNCGGLLRCTANHRLFTSKGWKRLADISLGEDVYAGFYPDGTDKLGFLTAFDMVGIEDVWDIEVEEDHSYVAGGFVNHNSSSDPNMQNLPRDENSMRKAFSAPHGKKLLVADYSQLELRLMAHQSQDKAMLEIYRTGGDIHDNTLKALGLKERTVAKNCNFGLIYGLYPQGLKDQLWNKAKIDKTLDECAQWRAGFFATYAGVPSYHNHVEAFLNKNGYVKTLTGRRRHLKELMQKDFKQALRMGINYTIQASAADIMLIAMRNIHRKILENRLHNVRWNDVLMLMQVHDELVFEVPEDLTEEVSVMVKDGMENAVKISVPLEVDPGIADNWEEAKG